MFGIGCFLVYVYGMWIVLVMLCCWFSNSNLWVCLDTSFGGVVGLRQQPLEMLGTFKAVSLVSWSMFHQHPQVLECGIAFLNVVIFLPYLG
jgi:hypothetical protein